MRKKFLYFVISIITIVIFGKACSNNVDQNEIISKERKVALRNINISCNLVLNDQNQYNYVGQIHNEILTSYLSIYEDDTTDVNLIIERINEIANNNANFIAIKDSSYCPIEDSIIISGANDFENQFSNVISNFNVSNQVKNKLSELINYFFTKANQTNVPTLREVDNYFINFENEVINNNYYTLNDKRTLLSAISTARYSSCFWYYYLDVENSSMREQAKRKWWQWAIVGAADVLGAAIGSIPATATAGVAGATIVTAASAASTAAFTMTNPNNK